MMDGERLLKTTQVAQLLGTSLSNFYERIVTSPDFPLLVEVVPGTKRYRQSEVIAWLDSRPRINPRVTA